MGSIPRSGKKYYLVFLARKFLEPTRVMGRYISRSCLGEHVSVGMNSTAIVIGKWVPSNILAMNSVHSQGCESSIFLRKLMYW